LVFPSLDLQQWTKLLYLHIQEQENEEVLVEVLFSGEKLIGLQLRLSILAGQLQ